MLMQPDPNEHTDNGAGLSLWSRVNQDPQYLAAKRVLQTRYRLPLPYDIRLNYGKWQRWLGKAGKPTRQRQKRGEAFLKQVHALLKKYEVPEAWYPDFIAEIAGKPASGKARDLDLPQFNFTQAANGDWKWECTLTPETDLTDPFILELIQTQQKEYAGAPPQPAKNPVDRRKLDWQPVLEWHQRHPLFSIAELAEKIGFAPATVRRSFQKLTKGK
jgi:hypothetical protein